MKCLVLDTYFSAILQYNINNMFTTRSPQIQKKQKDISIGKDQR
jgi:hypothetical protein